MTVQNKFSILRTVSFAMYAFLMCATPLMSQSGNKGDSSAIFTQFALFQKALLAHDTLSIGNFYLDTPVSLLQNQPVRHTRDAIVQRWKRSLANPIVIRMTSDEIDISSTGQDAFQYGKFEIHTSDTTNTLLASGKIMLLWKKQSSGWKIGLEMDNFNSMPSQKTSPQTKQ